MEIADLARTWLPVQNEHEWGTYSLRRIIHQFVCEPLADYLLEKNPTAGAKIKVEVEVEGIEDF